MEFHISLIRDIMSVVTANNEVVHAIDGNLLVSHQYRGHNIVTWFKGDGIMYIYETDTVNPEHLKNLAHVLYDTHSYMSNTHKGYRKALAELIGE